MNLNGLWMGIGSFLIIGFLHPVVIKAEYHIGKKSWLLFFVAGITCITISLFCDNLIFASLLAVLGFSLFWSILELFEQEKRIEKGWFPANKKKKGGDLYGNYPNNG